MNFLKTRNILINSGNSLNGIQLQGKELERLQIHLVHMYKDIEQICEKYKLSLCLAYGNVLGAMRHNGWIPWDDDLDIHMPRKDYELFLKKYSKELPSYYKVYSAYSTDGPIARFAKIIDTRTTFVELNEKRSEHSGVFIDIFPIDNIGKSSIINKFKKFFMYFLMYVAGSVKQVEINSIDYKKVMFSSKEGKKNFYLRSFIGKAFGFFSSKKWNCLIEKFWREKEESGFVHIKQARSMCGMMVPEEIFFPFKKFDTKIGSVFLPHDPAGYLNIIYKNWQEIPSEDKRWHHFLKEFNIPENL